MHPLARHVWIAVTALVLAIGIVGGVLWYVTYGTVNDPAALVPADRVVAYVEFQKDDWIFGERVTYLAPSLTMILPDPGATTIVGLRSTDDTIEWISFPQKDPHRTFVRNTSESLARDPQFRGLRFDRGSWAYFQSLANGPTPSPLAPILSLDTPLAFSVTSSGIVLRQPVQGPIRRMPESVRPIVSLQGAHTTIIVPSATDFEKLTPLFTDAAVTIAETLATRFVNGVATGLSLRYDLSSLLGTPGVLRIAEGGTMAFEGHGTSTRETDRVIRSLHAAFGGGSAQATVRDMVIGDAPYQVLTGGDHERATTERQEGLWTILETQAGDRTLVSAHQGELFAITTNPNGIDTRTNDATIQTNTSIIPWESASRFLAPLWPTLTIEGDQLGVHMATGPGYVEWTLMDAIGL